jgi:prepilin-type N-terminal cleavage/methylation domain-containing protein
MIPARGYTLVELMLVMAISAIIALVAAIIVITARQQIQIDLNATNLQQNLAIITEVLQQELRQAIAPSTLIYTDSGALEGGLPVNAGTCLKVGTIDSAMLVIYQAAQNFVVARPSGPQVLVNNCVDSLYFFRPTGADSARSITVRIRLSNHKEYLSTSQNYWLRN